MTRNERADRDVSSERLNRDSLQRALEEADRAAAHGRELIDQTVKLIAGLPNSGHFHTTDDARALLKTLQNNQADLERRRAEIRRQLKDFAGP